VASAADIRERERAAGPSALPAAAEKRLKAAEDKPHQQQRRPIAHQSRLRAAAKNYPFCLRPDSKAVAEGLGRHIY
jgi:hypothetical protein